MVVVALAFISNYLVLVLVFGKLVALKGIAPLSFSPEPLGLQ